MYMDVDGRKAGDLTVNDLRVKDLMIDGSGSIKALSGGCPAHLPHPNSNWFRHQENYKRIINKSKRNVKENS
jgi:hypothetical protein